MRDSYDGTISGRYPVTCYHQAIAHISTVDQIYTGTRDEIMRALQRALTGRGPTAPAIVGSHASEGVGLPLPLAGLAALALLLVATSAVTAVRRRLRKHPGS